MNALKEVKKQHLYHIVKDIYLHHSSTMNELVSRLHLSQPSIRNSVRDLQKYHILKEAGSDLSSGGRCPLRFSLHEDQYKILCFYIKHQVMYLELRNLNECLKQEKIFYHQENELISLINTKVKQYLPHCICISVEGIVKEDTYITDHDNKLTTHTWIRNLKKMLHIPVYLQNDVKMMHQGYYFHYQKNHSYYLHINEVGVGGSYFEDYPVYGVNGIAGEIGLIHYQGKSVNQCIRECQSQEEFNRLLCFVLEVIITVVDPCVICLSLHSRWQYQKEIIQMVLQETLGEHLIYEDQDYRCQLFDGMQYIGVMNLTKERIENNEKI